MNVLAAADDLHRVSIQLHDRVIGEEEHSTAGLHVVQQDTTVAVVIDEVVCERVIAVIALRMDSRIVVIGNDAAYIPVAVADIQTRAEIAIDSRVTQGAALPTDARRVAPTGDVMNDAVRVARRIEARAIVVCSQI